MKRLRRRDPQKKARAALRFAEGVREAKGEEHPSTIAAYDVAADAFEDEGDLKIAQFLRLVHIARFTGKGYGYGISPPHGIYSRRECTMAAVRRLVRAEEPYYFRRATRRFWGKEQYWGPYAGPGGLTFVMQNGAGTMVKEVSPKGTIRDAPGWSRFSVGRTNVGAARAVMDARKVAQDIAKYRPVEEWFHSKVRR